MKWLAAICGLVFVLLQYQIWLGDDGFLTVVALQKKTQKTQEIAQKIDADNQALINRIHQIKTSPAALEGYARRHLGMVKKNEVFYHFDHVSKSP